MAIRVIYNVPLRMRSEISGTAGIMDGLSTAASPFEPFLIRDDLSDKVRVDE